MKHATVVYIAMAALMTFGLASAAQADSVDVSLTHASKTATPGSTITFDATITNLSSTDTIYLNGDTSTTSSLLLTVDDTPFLTNFPLALAPNEVSGPFALFNVFVDPTTPDGTYDFNSFSLLGGSDSKDFQTIGTTNFSIIVANVTPAPEPKTFYLLLLGTLLLCGITKK